jgi:glutamate carboxypeptidase
MTSQQVERGLVTVTSPGIVSTEPDDRETLVGLTRELTDAESPSHDDDALRACADVLTRLADEVVGVPADLVTLRDGGPPAVRVRCGGDTAQGRVLLLGHYDTVWPLGTLADRPFTVRDGRITGPGVFDMKAGLAQALVAMRAVGCAGDTGPAVTLLVTYDEEVGSPDGRALLESTAAEAQAVLVLEPAGPNGAPKHARKGWARYEVVVTGRAAHVGLDPDAGRNALVDLARLVTHLDRLDRGREGLRVIPTTARAGQTSNTIPGHAQLNVDVRGERADDLAWVDDELRALVGDAGRGGQDCELELTGGLNRPPMEPDTAEALAQRAARCARELRVDLPPPIAVGGVSDGNFTAALSVPTLDGLGAVGGGAHADHEWVDATSMPSQAALLAALVHDLTAAPLR